MLQFDQGGKWKPVTVTGYERLDVTMDSGTVDTMGPAEAAAAFAVEENEASRKGMKYNTADGTKVPNE